MKLYIKPLIIYNCSKKELAEYQNPASSMPIKKLPKLPLFSKVILDNTKNRQHEKLQAIHKPLASNVETILKRDCNTKLRKNQDLIN